MTDNLVQRLRATVQLGSTSDSMAVLEAADRIEKQERELNLWAKQCTIYETRIRELEAALREIGNYYGRHMASVRDLARCTLEGKLACVTSPAAHSRESHDR